MVSLRRRRWFEREAGLLEIEASAIERRLPTFALQRRGDAYFLAGSLRLTDLENRIEIARYDIEAQYPDDYPGTIPIVREIGGRLSKIKDRHFGDDGSACLFVPDERWKFFPDRSTIVDLIGGPVTHFFLSQAYQDLEGRPLFAGRAHGTEGILEYYREELQVADDAVVVRCLEQLARNARHYALCFCGSCRQIRRCHLRVFTELQKNVPTGRIRQSLALIRRHRGDLAFPGPQRIAGPQSARSVVGEPGR